MPARKDNQKVMGHIMCKKRPSSSESAACFFLIVPVFSIYNFEIYDHSNCFG